MIVSSLNLACPLVQIIVTVVVCGLLALVFLVKLYNYATCVYYQNLNNMDGKTVIITGGNGGIGKETAKEIAKRGARSEPRLDVLLHNAGMAATKIEMTEDNIESTMATNHFGPFLLTHLLIDLLKKSAPSRVVVVASELYRLVSLNLNNINPTRSCFVPRLYYVSKYANICFTKELARRLEGSGVTANCLHPGLVDTEIWMRAPALFRWPLQLVVKGFFKTPVQGCQTSVYVACAEEIDGVTGKYFSECKEKGVSRGANDENKAKKLWELSENLVRLTEDDPRI
ncbi:retinol dehydrogenase 14, partial [Asbolus verrucosus]